MFSVVDGTKSVALDLQKFSRCPIIVLTADLVQAEPTIGTIKIPGRINAQDSFNQRPIAIERVRHATLICPDQVIGRIRNTDSGSAQGIITASKKQTRYVRVTYNAEGGTGDIFRVDEENPIDVQL